KIQDFLDVYLWFNNNKPGLFDNLSKLNSTNQSWSDWEELASFLYPDDHNQVNRVYFLDKIVAQKFTAEGLKNWFNSSKRSGLNLGDIASYLLKYTHAGKIPAPGTLNF
ncbi:MAG: hypothetical protein MGF17_16815, partial [Trichodesmium sp. MAG_R04]|nr:hypothetical protein [Trichodesmium sp. MAG_R04]